MRAKTPGIEMGKYSKPANLPGFLMELMCPPLCESGLRYAGGCPNVTGSSDASSPSAGDAPESARETAATSVRRSAEGELIPRPPPPPRSARGAPPAECPAQRTLRRGSGCRRCHRGRSHVVPQLASQMEGQGSGRIRKPGREPEPARSLRWTWKAFGVYK